MKRMLVGLCFVLSSSLAWALPTVKQVEAQVQQGNYAQAETMMGEVVAAKPDSARAHYTYAEILAHNANFSKASQEASKARQLDPALSFADPEKFRAFEALLQRELNPPARVRAAPSVPSFSPTSAGSMSAPVSERGGVPGWIWLAGLVVLAIVVWRFMTRNRAAGAAAGAGFAPAGMAANGGYPAGNAPYGGNPGYGPGGMPYGGNGPQPGAGGGLLRTGLAVGAGVAGGMLIDEMMHRRSDGSTVAGGSAGALGGFDPDGYNPAADGAARDLESRPIDFGQGGDDWDSGGGSIDTGGGDSGGGGGWD